MPYGGLDLALGMKKDAPEAFEALRPALAAFQNPTGREQVLLAQLTGKDGGWRRYPEKTRLWLL